MAAASDQPEASYSAGRIEQLLRCPICLDRFKRPKLLPCQHTFCKSPCLEGLWGGYRRIIRCPECRVEHRVPMGGVDGFPNNITLSGFLDLPVLDASTREPPPAPAAPTTTTTTKCAVCGSDADTRQCVHCDKPVCPPCRHSHMAQMKLGIGHLLRQLRDGLPSLTRSLDGAAEWGEATARRVAAARAAMTTAIDAKVRALRDRQTMLGSELDSFVQQERRALEARREAVEVDVASVSSFCESAERALQALDAGDETSLVDMQRQCAQQLEKVRRARPPASPHVARRVTYVQQNADQLQESIERFGQFQFHAAGESPPAAAAHTRSGPDVTFSDVPNPDIFFDLPDYGDITGSGTGRHDPPFHSPRLDLLSSASGASLFPPIRQEAPSVPRPEETRVAATGSPEVFFPPLSAVEPTQAHAHARDPHAHVPRRVRDYMYEMDTSTDDVRDIVDAMRREVLGPRRHAGGTLFTYDVRQVDPGFPPGAGDAAIEPRENTEAGETTSPAQAGERVEMEVDTAAATAAAAAAAAAAATPQTDQPATMSRGRTFIQPGGARSAAVELPVVNNQSTSFNIAVDDGVRRRRRYDRDTAAASRALTVYQAKGRLDPVCTIQGSASCRLKWPRGVAVSPINDFVIIADSANDRVQVFDSNGRFVSTFGGSGSSDGEFDRPTGAAVTSSGDIVVCDSNNHRVQVFDRHGHFSHAFGSEGAADGQLSNPWGVAVDSSGLVYVCDRDNDRVQVFDAADGAFVRVIGRGGSERGRLLRPQYVAVSPRNNVVVVSDSGNHRVQTFDAATGEPLRSFGIEGSAAGMLRNPKGVGVDRDGFVVVADSGNNRVQVYREDGQFVSAFGAWGTAPGNFRGLEGVAVTASHKVFVGDRENHRVQKF